MRRSGALGLGGPDAQGRGVARATSLLAAQALGDGGGLLVSGRTNGVDLEISASNAYGPAPADTKLTRADAGWVADASFRPRDPRSLESAGKRLEGSGQATGNDLGVVLVRAEARAKSELIKAALAERGVTEGSFSGRLLLVDREILLERTKVTVRLVAHAVLEAPVPLTDDERCALPLGTAAAGLAVQSGSTSGPDVFQRIQAACPARIQALADRARAEAASGRNPEAARLLQQAQAVLVPTPPADPLGATPTQAAARPAAAASAKPTPAQAVPWQVAPTVPNPQPTTGQGQGAVAGTAPASPGDVTVTVSAGTVQVKVSQAQQPGAVAPGGALACPVYAVLVPGGVLAVEGGAPLALEPFCLDKTEAWHGYPKLPVGRRARSSVSWNEAAAACRTAGGRLPTEAEWVFAARGPEGRRFPWGNQEPACGRANHGACDGSDADIGVNEAGATPLGIFELGGNLREWVADRWNPVPFQRGDNLQDSKVSHVLRGAGWSSPAAHLEPSFRDGANLNDDYRDATVGFRCAYTPRPAPTSPPSPASPRP
ncbi:MAG: hypothetical protein RL653_4549 [Pseudomonadota bacterium]|jgi:hypothetical protein